MTAAPTCASAPTRRQRTRGSPAGAYSSTGLVPERGIEPSPGEADLVRAYLEASADIPLAVRALKDGLSHSVLLQTDNWDTHQNNGQQSMLHESLFASLGTLVQSFEDAGTFDDTLFVVLSEMGRTPRLNGDGGKDHWPVTSAMIFGGGVRGGRVFGGTSDDLDALSVDLSTGEVDAGGNQLQAANFVAGIYSALGVDPEPHLPGVEPFDAFCA